MRMVKAVPVTAGRTYILSADVNAATLPQGAGTFIAINWYNSAGSQISQSYTPTSNPKSGMQTLTLTATAPAGATNARAEIANSNNTANGPRVVLYIDNVRLEVPAANMLAPNDTSFETSVAGWEPRGNSGTTLVQSTAWATQGTHSAQLTGTSTSGGWIYVDMLNGVAVNAGQMYTMAADVNVSGLPAGAGTFIAINWYDSTGSFISQSYGNTANSETGVQTLVLTAAAPSGATSARLVVADSNNMASGTVSLYVDNVRLNVGSTPVAS